MVTDQHSIDMQDRTPSVVYRTQIDPLKPGEDKTIHIYSCSACRITITVTMEPMSDDGIASKMRQHRCQSPGKQDFERELR